MKKVFLILFGLLATLTSAAQELNSFKFIIVPAEFEFLKEPNQYELNALTKFLLEKKGYEVFLEGEENLGNINGNRCDALLANVRNESGLLVTRLQLILEDCRGKEVFTSEVGDSRIKKYKQSFHEALRKAVASLPERENIYEEIVVSGIPEVHAEEDVEAIEEVEGEVIEETTNSSIKQSPEARQTPKASVPDVARLDFIKGNGKYFLTKTENGYNFYQQGMEEPFASLIESSTGSGYVYSSITSKGMAQFSESGNLIVEILNPKTNELEAIEYKLQDQ